MAIEVSGDVRPTLITLGQLRLEPAGDRAPGRKDLLLLALLARRSPDFVSRAELATFLWGDRGEERARQSLRQSLSTLRKSVGSVLEQEGDGVRVAPGALTVDVALFESAATAGKHGQAATLWTGEFLPGADDVGGEVFREWLDCERARLYRLLTGVMTAWAMEADREEEWAELEVRARRWAEVNPASIAPRTLWVRALLRGDRPLEAAARFAEFDQQLLLDGSPHRESDEWRRLRQALEVSSPSPITDESGVARPTHRAREGEASTPLREAWARAAAGGSALVVLSAESPADAADQLDGFHRWLATTEDEALVLSVSVPEGDTCEPWSAARALLARLREAPGLGGASNDALAALSFLVPSLRERFPNLPERDPDPVLAPALAEVLACVADEVALAIIADGVERMDEESVALLLRLASEVPPGSLLLLTASERAPQAAVVKALLRRENRVHIRVPPSSRAQSNESLESGGIAPAANGSEVPVALFATARRRRVAAGSAALLLLVSLFFGTRFSGDRSPEGPIAGAPVVAIGEIRDFTGGNASLAQMLPDLLATNLARADELHVISSARMNELLSRAGATSNGPARLVSAARSAGAGELIEGALYRTAEGQLRLDLRRVRLEDGSVAGSYTTVAPDAFQLVDAATAQILREVGAEGVPLRVADVTTRSEVAFRFYSEGLRAFYQGDDYAAEHLFEAALREDSTFAMAAYYAAHSARADSRRMADALDRAHRLSRHADDRQRLLIHGMRADFRNDPARTAIAETLAVRYPAEPDGAYLLGRARMWGGDFLGAVPHLRRVIEMDSAGAREGQPRCRSCEASIDLVNAYMMADSMAAAEREARAMVRRMPNSSAAIDVLANALDGQGRHEEALTLRRNAEIQPAGTTLQLWEAIYAIRIADFPRADRILRAQVEGGNEQERAAALWYLTIALRYQGRFDEALGAATEYRRLAARENDGYPPGSATLEAIVRFEAGQFQQAAALFDSLASRSFEGGEAWNARMATWMLTHAATAHAAAGDTLALRRLIPQLREYGSRSSYGRDRLLHRHALGLLRQARGDHRGAERAFRAAIFSNTHGYTRTNLELARTLLHLNRPAEAVEVLRPTFRGPLQASNLYATHAELHEALALAAEAAGDQDTAIEHYQWLVRAWAGADTPLLPRRERARSRITELTGRGEPHLVSSLSHR